MKNNLKTFPDRDKYDESEWCHEVGLWLGRFQREVKKKRKVADSFFRNHRKSPDEVLKAVTMEQMNLLGEILGE